MRNTPNTLSDAFPEQTDAIHALKMNNAHFAKLADAYHEVNDAIHRGETNVEPMDDFHMEDLRKRRLQLKDEIAGMLRDAG